MTSAKALDISTTHGIYENVKVEIPPLVFYAVNCYFV
ncbi:hypothetical protein LINPERPRIM_LOCUS25179 [Linum perenne]